jgi:hypothetical protein
LRLGQSDVRRLAADGTIEESTAFGPATDNRFVSTLCAAQALQKESNSLVFKRQL